METASWDGFVRRSPRSPVLIPKGNTISGDIDIDGRIHIDGRLIGSLVASRSISVGCVGICESYTLRAKEMIISGTIYGNIHCEKLEVLDGAVIIGQISCVQFIVDKGAYICGQINPITQEIYQEMQNHV